MKQDSYKLIVGRCSRIEKKPISLDNLKTNKRMSHEKIPDYLGRILF